MYFFMGKQRTKHKILLGVDQLPYLKKLCFGPKTKTALLCHPASLDQNLHHIKDTAESLVSLTAFFGPQHGIQGETQDNMIEWQDQRDSSQRPVYSLYGQRRKPTLESLKGIDLVVVDLFDVGARYYTFIYTLAYMMETCAEAGVPILVCDRPNPLGGNFIEGPLLDLEYRSFVGRYELPICHGLTIGELAKFFASKIQPAPKLHIIPMKGWKRKMNWKDTQTPWGLPSPNMPNFEAAVLYPGMCLIEGMSISEGRGTTRPFELIGAPFFDWDKIEREYQKIAKSLRFTPAHFLRQGFIPTFHKHSGELCKGVIQVVRDPKSFQPVRHAVTLFWIFRQFYGNKWSWKRPPYEYEFEKLPIDILCGGPEIRDCIDQGASLKKLFESWTKDEKKFAAKRKPFLIY